MLRPPRSQSLRPSMVTPRDARCVSQCSSSSFVQRRTPHGAFSEILILPGESAQDFEQLKNDLFAEYKPSGISEERALIAVAKSLWQERRLALYHHVQHARAAKSSNEKRGNPNAINEAIQQFRIKKGLVGPGEVDPKPGVTTTPPKSAEERITTNYSRSATCSL